MYLWYDLVATVFIIILLAILKADGYIRFAVKAGEGWRPTREGWGKVIASHARAYATRHMSALLRSPAAMAASHCMLIYIISNNVSFWINLGFS